MSLQNDAPYAMPHAEVGMDVLWYPHGDKHNAPLGAKVTKVGFENVCVAIFHPDSHNLMIRDGVRHCEDPRATSHEKVESGCWDYPEWFLKLLRSVDGVVREAVRQHLSDAAKVQQQKPKAPAETK